MRPGNTHNRLLSIWLAGFSALLVAVIVWELSGNFVPSQSDAVFGGTSNALPELNDRNFALSSPDAFAAMIDRPLFSSTRRPFVADAADEPELTNAVSVPTWNLVGTVITPGSRSALFWSQRSGQFIQLDVGMSSEGWELVEVATAAAILKRGDRRYEIELSH